MQSAMRENPEPVLVVPAYLVRRVSTVQVQWLPISVRRAVLGLPKMHLDKPRASHASQAHSTQKVEKQFAKSAFQTHVVSHPLRLVVLLAALDRNQWQDRPVAYRAVREKPVLHAFHV